MDRAVAIISPFQVCFVIAEIIFNSRTAACGRLVVCRLSPGIRRSTITAIDRRGHAACSNP
jgi:hypothetical protein